MYPENHLAHSQKPIAVFAAAASGEEFYFLSAAAGRASKGETGCIVADHISYSLVGSQFAYNDPGEVPHKMSMGFVVPYSGRALSQWRLWQGEVEDGPEGEMGSRGHCSVEMSS